MTKRELFHYSTKNIPMDQKENIDTNIELLFHIFLLFVINYIFNFEYVMIAPPSVSRFFLHFYLLIINFICLYSFHNFFL